MLLLDRPRCLRPALLLVLLSPWATGCFGGPTSDLPYASDDSDEIPTGRLPDGDHESTDVLAPSDPNATGAVADDPPACSWSTLPVEGVSCGGSHCTESRAQLSASPDSVCGFADSLDAVCTGAPQRVVHACWLLHRDASDRAVQVQVCASGDPLLGALGSACLECYVALHECVSQQCEGPCALENSAECEPCTRDQCVPAFTICSGLSAP